MKNCRRLSSSGWILLFFLLPGWPASLRAADEYHLLPRPVSLRQTGGSFRIDERTVVWFPSGSSPAGETARQLAVILGRAAGRDLPVSEWTGPGLPAAGIVFQLQRGGDVPVSGEGYVLQSGRKRVLIRASAPAGLFYGMQTMLQLLPPSIWNGQAASRTRLSVPGLEIRDWPRFPYRGMHLDVSRHFFPKDFIKRYLDLLALHKQNVFHWHLTDDNGWRLEIKKYPKLTEISAWRVDREDRPWTKREPARPGEKATYGGYYTQEDVRDILAYAANRHILVIPEIEMPAHCIEVLAAYPELSCTGGPFTVPVGSYWPNVDIFCAGRDETFTFLENVLDEVIALFPSPYIHIGGDEADKTRWKACPRCQARIKAEGLAGETGLQSWFMQRMERFVKSRGRRVIGWDEILEGGLPPDATVMSWRGQKGGIEAAEQGHDVIMSPTSHCYFDYYQANPEFEPPAIGGFLTLKKVYGFEPVPPGLTTEKSRHILGLQGNLWSEFVPVPRHAEYMAMPRLCAVAETGWTPREQKQWESFRRRLTGHQRRLDAMQVNYSRGSYQVEVLSEPAPGGVRTRILLDSEQDRPVIHYTLDGSVPTARSLRYRKPLVLKGSATVTAGIFQQGRMKEKAAAQTVFFHRGLGARGTSKNTPDPRYPGAGQAGLTDGLKARPESGHRQWQGFSGQDLEITLDLGRLQPVQTVTLTCLQDSNAWIFPAKSLTVACSRDGREFGEPIRVDLDVPGESEEILIKTLTARLPAVRRCRYLRIKAENLGLLPEWHESKGEKAWLFVDEIEVN